NAPKCDCSTARVLSMDSKHGTSTRKPSCGRQPSTACCNASCEEEASTEPKDGGRAATHAATWRRVPSCIARTRANRAPTAATASAAWDSFSVPAHMQYTLGESQQRRSTHTPSSLTAHRVLGLWAHKEASRSSWRNSHRRCPPSTTET